MLCFTYSLLIVCYFVNYCLVTVGYCLVHVVVDLFVVICFSVSCFLLCSFHY